MPAGFDLLHPIVQQSKECPTECAGSVDDVADRCVTCGLLIRRPNRTGVLRVVSWNRRHLTGAARTLDYLDGLEAGWDVALLIECQQQVAEAARERYGSESVASVFDHHVDTTMEKPHGPLVIVRNGLRIRSHQLTFPDEGNPDRPRPTRASPRRSRLLGEISPSSRPMS